RHGRARVVYVLAANETVRAAEGDAADAAAAQVLLHFAGKVDFDALFVRLDLYGVIDRGQAFFVELGVEGRADDLGDLAGRAVCGSGGHQITPYRSLRLKLVFSP